GLPGTVPGPGSRGGTVRRKARRTDPPPSAGARLGGRERGSGEVEIPSPAWRGCPDRRGRGRPSGSRGARGGRRRGRRAGRRARASFRVRRRRGRQAPRPRQQGDLGRGGRADARGGRPGRSRESARRIRSPRRPPTPAARIAVVIHPQSIVHSFVEFVDGSLIGQLGVNDMKFPILYALSYPERVGNAFGRLDLTALRRLEFFEVEPERYPAVALARA